MGHVIDGESKWLRAHDVQAVIAPLMHAPDYEMDVVWRHFPGVAMGLASHRPALPVCSADDWRRARAAWDYATGLGYQRIGLGIGRS